MKYFFRQIEDIPLDNSPVSAEIYFRGANATGLIEKQFDGGRAAVLLFISGEPGMAYLLENGQSRSISLAEFLSLIDGAGHTHAIKLPDVAGRLILLALESQIENKLVITMTKPGENRSTNGNKTNGMGWLKLHPKIYMVLRFFGGANLKNQT